MCGCIVGNRGWVAVSLVVLRAVGYGAVGVPSVLGIAGNVGTLSSGVGNREPGDCAPRGRLVALVLLGHGGDGVVFLFSFPLGGLADDRFRAGFLHGRQPLLAACAARLRGAEGLVWVDMGGGTAENVEMMSHIIDLSAFQKIYVVDLCSALCQVAREKVRRKGWRNVVVVEADCCTFVPAEPASLVTFSYSLSSRPLFWNRAMPEPGLLCTLGRMLCWVAH